MRIFYDSKGIEIKAGDILFREVYTRRRQFPGRKRVAIQSMGDREVIVSDEGYLLPAAPQWITRKVIWSGACMCAERDEYSDFQEIMSSCLFDKDGNEISESSAFHYMNNVFKSENYTIIDRR